MLTGIWFRQHVIMNEEPQENSNKKGTFVHLHQKTAVAREEWEKARSQTRRSCSGSMSRPTNGADASPVEDERLEEISTAPRA